MKNAKNFRPPADFPNKPPLVLKSSKTRGGGLFGRGGLFGGIHLMIHRVSVPSRNAVEPNNLTTEVHGYISGWEYIRSVDFFENLAKFMGIYPVRVVFW